jgi:hypothetical protein
MRAVSCRPTTPGPAAAPGGTSPGGRGSARAGRPAPQPAPPVARLLRQRRQVWCISASAASAFAFWHAASCMLLLLRPAQPNQPYAGIAVLQTLLRVAPCTPCRVSLPKGLLLDSLVCRCPLQPVYVGLARALEQCRSIHIIGRAIRLLLHVRQAQRHGSRQRGRASCKHVFLAGARVYLGCRHPAFRTMADPSLPSSPIACRLTPVQGRRMRQRGRWSALSAAGMRGCSACCWRRLRGAWQSSRASAQRLQLSGRQQYTA